jgi:hypothetical protein
MKCCLFKVGLQVARRIVVSRTYMFSSSPWFKLIRPLYLYVTQGSIFGTDSTNLR